MKYFWVVLLIAVFGDGVHSIEIDESKDCMNACESRISIPIPWLPLQPFHVMLHRFLALAMGPDDFETLCDDYSAFENCIKACPRGKERSKKIDVFKPLKEACTPDRLAEMKSTLACINDNHNIIHERGEKPCHRQHNLDLMDLHWSTSKNSEEDCDARFRNGFLPYTCRAGMCYMQFVHQACQPSEAWMNLVVGFIQPALMRYYQFCQIHPDAIPESCKALLDFEKKPNSGSEKTIGETAITQPNVEHATTVEETNSGSHFVDTVCNIVIVMFGLMVAF